MQIQLVGETPLSVALGLHEEQLDAESEVRQDKHRGEQAEQEPASGLGKKPVTQPQALGVAPSNCALLLQLEQLLSKPSEHVRQLPAHN